MPLNMQTDSYPHCHQRELPPYPGPPATGLNQSGLGQSYSGSEASTDLSLSSSENLSGAYSGRQEGQREDTSSLASTPDSLDGDAATYNMLMKLGLAAPPVVDFKTQATGGVLQAMIGNEGNYVLASGLGAVSEQQQQATGAGEAGGGGYAGRVGVYESLGKMEPYIIGSHQYHQVDNTPRGGGVNLGQQQFMGGLGAPMGIMGTVGPGGIVGMPMSMAGECLRVSAYGNNISGVGGAPAPIYSRAGLPTATSTPIDAFNTPPAAVPIVAQHPPGGGRSPSGTPVNVATTSAGNEATLNQHPIPSQTHQSAFMVQGHGQGQGQNQGQGQIDPSPGMVPDLDGTVYHPRSPRSHKVKGRTSDKATQRAMGVMYSHQGVSPSATPPRGLLPLADGPLPMVTTFTTQNLPVAGPNKFLSANYYGNDNSSSAYNNGDNNGNRKCSPSNGTSNNNNNNTNPNSSQDQRKEGPGTTGSNRTSRDRPRPSTAPLDRPTLTQHGGLSLPLPDRGGGLEGPPVAGGGGAAAAAAVDAGQQTTLADLQRSFNLLERLQLTQSQPDLTRLMTNGGAKAPDVPDQMSMERNGGTGVALYPVQFATPDTQGLQATMDPSTRQAVFGPTGGMDRTQIVTYSPSPRKLPDLDHAAIATRATQMVERLSEENRSLRQELEGYYRKVCRLQKVEHDIEKIQDNYSHLENHSRKQQHLSKLVRDKLDMEIKKLRDANKELQGQLDQLLQLLQEREVYSQMDCDVTKGRLRKDSLIAKLISQNRDLNGNRERLEAELGRHKVILMEQRNHLDILDSALRTARSSTLKYHEELKKRQREEEKVYELQRALTQLQLAVEKREAIEQQIQAKLEEEIQMLKKRQNVGKICEADEGILSDCESPSNPQSLMRELQEKDRKSLHLEAEVAKWKQKYLEEAALRHFAVDAASLPKEARIAALEQSSMDAEKIIADARKNQLRQLDEAHLANRKCAELEAKITMLSALVAEKQAMIKVLQRHLTSTCPSGLSSLLTSPLHSPRPSFASTPSPLSSPTVSSPLSSFSLSISSPPSGASSRQPSQLDPTTPTTQSMATCTADSIAGSGYGNSGAGRSQISKLPSHSKSNSTGSSVPTSCMASHSREVQLREKQSKLSAQAAEYLRDERSETDQLRFLWQV